MRGRQDEVLARLAGDGLIPAGAGQTEKRAPALASLGAHPRGCGADAVGLVGAAWYPGSSPRVRGRRIGGLLSFCGVGLIPAGAGQTGPRRGQSPPAWAHPRGCGADFQMAYCILKNPGSSPRVRGRLAAPLPEISPAGLIPAGAGQTSASMSESAAARAHPRGCGADRRADKQQAHVAGSSPRVRGRRRARPVRTGAHGLIPAGAGQTTYTPRGKNLTLGSSPRVRGRRWLRGQRQHRQGLIPAGAGQTGHWHFRHHRPGAHPRGCGADDELYFNGGEHRGSSPRVRGRPATRRVFLCVGGLIPAGAGQTALPAQSSGRTAAHPRGCGADKFWPLRRPRPWGSSPRVRGRRSLGFFFWFSLGAHPRGCGADIASIIAVVVARGSSPRVRGRPPTSRQRRVTSGAHPRGCGADTDRAGVGVSEEGSSPRVRGRRLRHRREPGGQRAHPRGCGADQITTGSPGHQQGSSPRVRGRRVEAVSVRQRCGLIPAGAGQTFEGVPRRAVRRAHPRGCGADRILRSRGGDHGSSPRVRGRRSLTLAGWRLSRAHPRGCGADRLVVNGKTSPPGSSPRVRGRRSEGRPYQPLTGLIPAGAGQTGRRPVQYVLEGAHPRGCGADRFKGVRFIPLFRLIPAGAGQTVLVPVTFLVAWAHPRGCGADRIQVAGRASSAGSSPRVRGRRGSRLTATGLPGLIPAGAGQTRAG